MRIRRYEGVTEQEAIQKVKEDLGKDALILNIKKTQPKGILKLFKKTKVEVMAAMDDKPQKKPILPQNLYDSTNIATVKSSQEDIQHVKVDEQEKIIKNLEQKLDNLEGLLTKVMQRVTTPQQLNTHEQKRKYNSTILQLFYNTLTKNEVLPELAEEILKDLDEIAEKDTADINNLVRIVYNRIITILGKPMPIQLAQYPPKIIVFIGPTGVGKTTTIAKITAHFILNEKKKVGLITADTYRIAAVEQLKTYAEILGVPVEVIYSSSELLPTIKKLHNPDLIFLDTAGRSLKNEDQFQELEQLLEQLPDKEIFLVLSVTTKYRDILNIIKAYSKISEYKIIFTKTDETTSLGTILNVCYLTGKPLSYVTVGQNVPDDIEIIHPEKIAKGLLGSTDE